MNPYIGNNPYTSQMADIGYPQVNYQSSMQDTSMQDMFQNEAMKQMQQLATPKPVETGGLNNSMALANALRAFGQNNQTPITSSALTSGMNGAIGSPVGLGSGPSGYGLGTGSTAEMGYNLFPSYGS